MKTLDPHKNLAKLTRAEFKLWEKERNAVLNSNNDEKLRAFIHKYRLPEATDEQEWQAAKHKARVHCRGIFPKLKKESRIWLQEHGYGGDKMKVKCQIPARSKECGECSHYIFPHITKTGECDSPPRCTAGRDLPTQKSPCPSYDTCIYGIKNTDKDIDFGYKLTAGGKVALVVREGKTTHYLAYFQNEEDANFFVKKVIEAIGIKKE